MNIQIEITELNSQTWFHKILEVKELEWMDVNEKTILCIRDTKTFDQVEESKIYWINRGYVFFEDNKWWYVEVFSTADYHKFENMIYNYLQEGLTLKRAFGIISL